MREKLSVNMENPNGPYPTPTEKLTSAEISKSPSTNPTWSRKFFGCRKPLHLALAFRASASSGTVLFRGKRHSRYLKNLAGEG